MNIVVRGANWIGDAVMTIPALRRIREIHPDSKITLHTRSWAEGVFRDAEFIDDILPIAATGSKIGSVISQVRQLRQNHFDLAVLFPNSFESALVSRLAGIPARLGYDTEKRGFLLTDRLEVPEWKGERHESNYYLNLIDPSGGENRSIGSESSLPVSAERKKDAQRLLVEKFGHSAGPIIGFGPGSTNSLAKRWPANNFAGLADELAMAADSKSILMGSTDESEVADAVLNTARTPILDLTGATDLSTATALLSVVDLFISNDMGLAHIAAAVGTPTIVIFGPTNDVTTRPLGDHVEIVREPVECSPCMLRVCPIDHRCMTRVTPQRVFESAIRMLETRTR